MTEALFIADATPIYSTVLAEVGRPVLPRQTFERCVANAVDLANRHEFVGHCPTDAGPGGCNECAECGDLPGGPNHLEA